MVKAFTKKLEIPINIDLIGLLGQYDRNIRRIKEEFGVSIKVEDNELIISSDDKQSIEQAAELFNELIEVTRAKGFVDVGELNYLIEKLREKDDEYESSIAKQIFSTSLLSEKIKPKTLGQKKYMEAMEKSDIVFAIGPAGTGKTYLAVAKAIDSLKKGIVQRIILTRPAIEAGEKLGFLPGTFMEKVDPYLRPLYDAMFDMLSFSKFQSYRERGIIEIAPLAYMRGRTLNNAFVILDEAQNTTHQQMKMFLTRIGFNSKAVITGDVTQIDLEKGKTSGLIEAAKILDGIEGITFVYLNKEDIVRHPLVKKIIKAYEEYERENQDVQ
ncbi:MAG: phosphate starvation-inducible protein PhoH [Thermotogaceae bacterium]|nr:phosphate starvation-inducible protein PhoH [Thermotogaceae bacterium]MDN5337272.1 phosphate starvation-inducible protein PhoH [Thermotogaceae bacterium]